MCVESAVEPKVGKRMKALKTITAWALLALGLSVWAREQYDFAIISLLASEGLAFPHDNE